MSVTSPRRTPVMATPSSSARPSLDTPTLRSLTSSPNPSVTTTPVLAAPKARANRAALREYYNIRRTNTTATTPLVEVTDPLGVHSDSSFSEIPASELDAPGLDAPAYVAKLVATNSLEDVLATYARVLGEMRALDAEKKALVYDNYSKLIAATESIRKMRATMDPAAPNAGQVGAVIGDIYKQAAHLRDKARERLECGDGSVEEEQKLRKERDRTRQLARIVLAMPARLRALVRNGKEVEARQMWERPRMLLVIWKEKGLGGNEVRELIEEGDGIVGGMKDGVVDGTIADSTDGTQDKEALGDTADGMADDTTDDTTATTV